MSDIINITRKITLNDVINQKTWLYVIKSSAEGGKFNIQKYVNPATITRSTQPIKPTKPLSTKFDSNTIREFKGAKFKQYKQAIIEYRVKIRAKNELLKEIGKVRIAINNTIALKDITHIKTFFNEWEIFRALESAFSLTFFFKKLRVKSEYRRA